MTISVLVPSSLVREAESKRTATLKLGYVARAAAVFRADRLLVFPDPEGERRWGGGFVETVLAYAATPPHLRKEAFGRRDELEYAGVLPPLRVPSWTGSESEDSGSRREGIVTQVGPEGRVRVNCGLQHPISLRAPPGMEPAEGERVTVRVSSRRPVRARLVDEPPPGFTVDRADLADALASPDAGRRIAASRHGIELSVGRLATLADRVERDGLTVAFGAPGRGLPAMLGIDPSSVGGDGAEPETDPERSGSEPDLGSDPGTDDVAVAPGRFDAWLNTVPNQGSEVVRTEEAMFATLACLNLR